MAQPRFRQYARLSHEPRVRKPIFGAGCRRYLFAVLVITLLAIFAAFLAAIVPVRDSLAGNHAPPSARGAIEPYSQARWYLMDAHASQLESCLAWYHRATGHSATTLAELDGSGFRPFLFLDERNLPVKLLDSSESAESVDDSFLLALMPQQGTTTRILTRRSKENSNIFGIEWLNSSEEETAIKHQSMSSVQGQFLPHNPGFDEIYACFLADVWESAVVGYIVLYLRPPTNLQNLLDGLGLVPNPDCVWPFDPEEEMSVACEGGLINSEIVYWQVTLLNGETRGQAKYWDYYTSYDDPDTPANIVVGSTSSAVVDPNQVLGLKRVMFTPDILMNLIDSVRPPEPEEEKLEEEEQVEED